LADWLTLNEKREATGFDEVEGGDVILVPISNIPLEEATAPPEPPPDLTLADPNAQDEGETAPADEPPVKSRNKSARKVIKAVKKSFWTNADRQKALWANFETRVRAREKSFLELAKTYMRGQALRIQEKVRVKPGLNGLRAEDLLDAKAETDLYVTRFTPWYRDHFIRAGNAGMRAAKGELFDDGEFKADKPSSWVFNMTPEQEAKLRDMIFNSGTKVNETTIEKIYAELIKAQDENMTVSEFARTIGEKVDELSRSRAMLWARTESAKTDNFGQVEGFKQTEFVDMKGWLCSFLPTSREDHMAASDQEVGVDESFKVGNEMLEYPGDPSGSAGEVCNCACSVYPVVGPGAGE
jgi:hypothetical protein